MSDEELLTLAREHPDELSQMIQSEVEAQGEFAMSKDELRQSQSFVARGEAALMTNVTWYATAHPTLPEGFTQSKNDR